jgi:inhibitor of cysteine peptidase
MKDRTLAILAIAFVVIVCVGLAAAYAFSGTTKVFNENNNTQNITIKNGETIKVVLDENPSTGYAWIINVTPGLSIVKDTFVPSSSGLAGAGGQHEWQIRATGAGYQNLTGIYKRSWEPTFGNETTYRINITMV